MGGHSLRSASPLPRSQTRTLDRDICNARQRLYLHWGWAGTRCARHRPYQDPKQERGIGHLQCSPTPLPPLGMGGHSLRSAPPLPRSLSKICHVLEWQLLNLLFKCVHYGAHQRMPHYIVLPKLHGGHTLHATE